MNYTKPEVAVLGQAVRVIELRHPQKGATAQLDGIGPVKNFSPAYDLDE
jgi:hypothetical protein